MVMMMMIATHDSWAFRVISNVMITLLTRWDLHVLTSYIYLFTHIFYFNIYCTIMKKGDAVDAVACFEPLKTPYIHFQTYTLIFTHLFVHLYIHLHHTWWKEMSLMQLHVLSHWQRRQCQIDQVHLNFLMPFKAFCLFNLFNSPIQKFISTFSMPLIAF